MRMLYEPIGFAMVAAAVELSQGCDRGKAPVVPRSAVGQSVVKKANPKGQKRTVWATMVVELPPFSYHGSGYLVI